MDKKRVASSVLATAMTIDAMIDGPYSSSIFKLHKPSKRPVGYAVACCMCGNGNTTLRKLSDGKRICIECYNKIKEE